MRGPRFGPQGEEDLYLRCGPKDGDDSYMCNKHYYGV
ncbi:uncharacterized protein ARMOST_21431 [Armillaria ostoyae]|uniref:Uncharacterized protein n=1 Tax=Armillaria ostoyae TaxID=47428 RepID=A0A284SA71_ARMOS|nr:uncharacterized protein ARMOST_21431 [Armillaria ostoyae]